MTFKEILEAMKRDPEGMGKAVRMDPTACAGKRIRAHGREWIVLVEIRSQLYLAAEAGSTYPADVKLVREDA